MKMENSKLRPLLFGILFSTAFLIPIFDSISEAAGLSSRMRHRLSTQEHHGLGSEGPGVCPQQRFTATAPKEIRDQTNPIEANHKNLEAGRSFFHTDAQPTACKVCHGPGGNGLGMMARGLNPPPRNFSCNETMKYISDGQLFWIIKNGSPETGMPPYKLNLKDNEIWQIILYLRQFSSSK